MFAVAAVSGVPGDDRGEFLSNNTCTQCTCRCDLVHVHVSWHVIMYKHNIIGKMSNVLCVC